MTNCIDGPFRTFWERNGGREVFGYPITPQRKEQSRDDGRLYEVQWFERARFELHPELPRPYDVLMGRIGDELLLQKGIDWKKLPAEPGPKQGCRWFVATKHNVCDVRSGARFKTFWEIHGVRDSKLTRYQRSLALFGLPLTEARMETNTRGERVLTQWFERMRFEYHPRQPNKERVLLGNETYAGAPPPPSVAATVRPADLVDERTVVRIDVTGFTPDENTRFWLTAPDSGKTDKVITSNIGPSGNNYILWDTSDPTFKVTPGLWAWVVEGETSKHRAIAYIKIRTAATPAK